MYTRAFRNYVRRIERQALAGRLDAIRTLGAIAIALAAVVVPGHGATMTDAKPLDTPSIAPPTPAGEVWTIQALVFIHGAPVHVIKMDPPRTFLDGDACRTAVLADMQLRASADAATAAALKRYGPESGVVVVCALDLQ